MAGNKHYSKDQKSGKRMPQVKRNKGAKKGGNRGTGLPMMKKGGSPMRVSV